MNLYRKFIAIFICLLVNYGSKPVESVVNISHTSSSTTPSGGSDGSQPVSGGGSSATPAAGDTSVISDPGEVSVTQDSSEAQQPNENEDTSESTQETKPGSESQPSSGQGTGTGGQTATSPMPRARPAPTSGATPARTSSAIALPEEEDDQSQPENTSEPQPSSAQGTSPPAKTSTDASQTQSSSSSTAQPRKTGFDLDITSDTQSTDKFDYKKVGEYVTYSAKGDNAFKIVKEGSTNIWEATSDTNYSSKVEVEHMNNDSKAVTIHTDDKTKIFIRSASGQPWTEIDTTKVNDRTININFPNESYFYTNELKGETRTFSAKKGFAFKGANDYVNDKKVEVWKTDEESEYANKIVNEGGKKVTLHLADGSTKVIQKGSDGKWPPDSETSKTGVDLNIKSDKKSNKKLEYEKVGEYVTYIAKDNYAFKLVKDHKTEVWKATDATNYSPRVEVEFLANDGKAVTIFLRKNKTKVFKKEGTNDPWKEIDLAKVTASSVNINYPHQSYFYKNELKGKIRTFSAKTGFAFKYANEYIDGNKVEIWKTDNDSEYSNKIEVDLMNNDAKAVTIHLGENKTKVFIKSGKNEPWKEIDTTKVNPKSVNIDYENSSYFYSNKLDNGVRTFTAKTGFMFNLVRHLVNNDWVEIWKTDNESEYSNKVVNEGGKKLTIYIGDDGTAKVFNKGSDGKWTEEPSESQQPEDPSESQPEEPSESQQSEDASGSQQSEEPSESQQPEETDSTQPQDGSSSGPRTRSAPTSGGAAPQTSTSISLDEDENEDQSQSEQASESQPSPAQVTSPPAGSAQGTGTSSTQPQSGTPTQPEDSSSKQSEQDGSSTEPEKGDSTSPEDGTGQSGEGAPATPAPQTGSSTQPQVKLLKANASDPNNPLELLANEYTTTTSNNMISYNIASGVNCAQLKFGDVLLWEHDPNQRGGRYPKSVDHYTNTDVLLLRFAGLDITFDKNEQGGWIFTESGPLAAKFYVVDPNDSSNSVELASDQFTITESGDVTTFTIADSVNSIGLTYGPVLLWQHDPNKQGGKHPKSLDFTATTETLILKFEGLDMTFAKNAGGEWEYTENTTGGGAAATPEQGSSTQADGGTGQSGEGAPATPAPQTGSSTQPQVKLLKANASDPNNPLELLANEYTTTTSNNMISYNIASGVNCAQLKFGDVLLWEHDPNQRGGRYPKSVDHYTNTDVLLLRFAGLDITFDKNEQGGWIFTESGPLAAKFYVVDPNDSSNSVELASDQFTITESGDVTTFTIADSVNSIGLTYGPVLLWQHDPNKQGGKHPKSLDFTATTETLILKFEGLDMTFAKNAGGEWEYTENTTGGGAAATPEQGSSTQADGGTGQSGEGAPATPAPQTGSSTQPQVKLLKANASDPNNPLELLANEYTSTTNNNVTSYNIASGVNCAQLKFGDVLLWEHDPNQRGGRYPKSVDHDKNTNVLVLRFAGLDISFENTAEGWIFTESGPLAAKFYVVDPNDPNNSVELGSNQFTITESGDVTTFTIADSVNSIGLTYGTVLLWQHDANKQGGKHPKSLDFTTSTETLVLKFEGLDIKFEKNDQDYLPLSQRLVSLSNTLVLYSLLCFGNFVYSHSSRKRDDKKYQVTLDIQNKKSNSDYIYYSLVEYSPVVVFTYSARGNTVFNEVKDGYNLVWKTSNEKEYSTKVVVEEDKLFITCPSDLLVFLKQEDGTWKSKDLDEVPGKEKAAGATAPKESTVPIKDVAAENAELKVEVAKLEKELIGLKMEYDQFRSKVLSVDNSLGKVVEALGGV
ncbi:hypothetical protein MACJ_001648 [Theileria orientalis]|uniref:SfiI-subtelomeric related protein family member n=1 Tax=Theileria orientalis TaxID=68886 RepID=A0A976MAJ6_THEOR|nr:hypothetical protein MACJ_001648 [Theileria orientalis]